MLQQIKHSLRDLTLVNWEIKWLDALVSNIETAIQDEITSLNEFDDERWFRICQIDFEVNFNTFRIQIKETQNWNLIKEFLQENNMNKFIKINLDDED